MSTDEFEDFVTLAKKEKKGRRLHTIAQERLSAYLSYLYPRDCAVSEVSGVLGGRNDLMLFSFNGRCAVFEFFFSPSQVPQDLRLLELAKADIKVAILLDREVNPKLAREYFRKKPDHFPFIWLSDLWMSSRKELCLKQLHELIRLVNENIPFSLSLFVTLPNRPLLSGEVVPGHFELSGEPISEAAPKIMQQIKRGSNGSTPVSFSISTADRNTSDYMEGDIKIQY